MAETVKVERAQPERTLEPTAAVAGPARALPRTGTIESERIVGRLLKMGALGSGVLFGASLIVGSLSTSATASVAADVLRKAGGSILLVTPVARLVVGGFVLGVRGEWRYALYAGAILFLLAVALGTGTEA